MPSAHTHSSLFVMTLLAILLQHTGATLRLAFVYDYCFTFSLHLTLLSTNPHRSLITTTDRSFISTESYRFPQFHPRGKDSDLGLRILYGNRRAMPTKQAEEASENKNYALSTHTHKHRCCFWSTDRRIFYTTYIALLVFCS